MVWEEEDQFIDIFDYRIDRAWYRRRIWGLVALKSAKHFKNRGVVFRVRSAEEWQENLQVGIRFVFFSLCKNS